MNPTADARTGRKAYADCRRDCRNTGINIQRDQQEVNARALLPAPDSSFFHQFNRERTAFPIHIGIKQRDRERVNSGNLTGTVCQIAIYFPSRFTELGGIGKFFTQL
jgi:hypothetical protein